MDKVKTVGELIAALLKLDQNAPVCSQVQWANDTASSDKGEELSVSHDHGTIVISGWMAGCSSELEFEEEGDEEA